MTELLTSAQMRAIEAAAIASGVVTGLELMERAGRGVVEAVFDEWPELRAGSFRAVVLCGPGGNGGDGFVVARVLKEWGWEVEVFLYGEPERMPPDARVNYERWRGVGEVRTWIAPAINAANPDLFVDAVFGTGLTRPSPADVAEPLLKLSTRNRIASKTVSVDVPSGMCADSGRFLDGKMQLVCADLTVTFHRSKLGHIIGRGPHYCGRLATVDIGLPDTDLADDATRHHTVLLSDAAYLGFLDIVRDKRIRLHHEIDKAGSGHKFSHGHALILCGPRGHGGAARMTARGALRIGAGLVTLAVLPEALAENAARVDAVMLKTVADAAGLVTLGVLPEALTENAARLDAVMLRVVADAAGLAEVLADARITAVCIGPGLGLDDRAAKMVRVALEGWGSPRRAIVVDADALTLLSRDETLFGLLHETCVLTPHAGEFARLFPDIAAKLEAPATTGPAYSKVDATREAAKRAGCVVLFKGPDTVIAAPDGRCSINAAAYDRAAPWLATAGSGDVLAGFITGLLARGFAPMQAAETGAWLHVECARSFGPGLIAEDLAEELPKVFRALGV